MVWRVKKEHVADLDGLVGVGEARVAAGGGLGRRPRPRPWSEENDAGGINVVEPAAEAGRGEIVIRMPGR